MRGVRRDLNCVLVAVYLLFEDVRRHFSLANEALGNAATQINDSGDARAQSDLRQIQNVLNDVELKVVFLLETGTGDADSDAAIGDARTENRHPRFVSRGEHTVFGGNLSQFTTQQMQELARRIRTRLIQLAGKASDPLFGFVIFLFAGEEV